MHFQMSPLIRKRVQALAKLKVPLTAAPDFNDFWRKHCQKVNRHQLNAQSAAIPYPLENIEIRDTTFAGLDGTIVKAWIILPPAARDGKVPAMVWYHGGGGSRFRPYEHLRWVAAGFAVVAMDFRQQGGETGSATSLTRCGAQSFIVMNIETRDSYFLYHAWTDALLCLRLAMSTPEIDARRVAVGGSSQGGGTALAIAALDHRVAACVADVPSYCWWDKRIVTQTASGGELAAYLRRYPHKLEQVYRTMSYFDVMNFTGRIRCPVMVSCGLNDEAVPPECIFAAYNRITAEKSMNIYPFGRHNIEPWQAERQLAWLRARLHIGKPAGGRKLAGRARGRG